jgi:predicted DCC family thiol-disulfide oxidoreductase YuxK
MMPRAALLYDDDCGFCRWSVARILRRDMAKSLQPLAIQGPDGSQLLASVAPERRLESWHLVLGERVFSGGDVFAPLLRLLGRPGAAALLDRAPRMTNWAYYAVAGRRSLFGSLVPRSAKRRADALIQERSQVAQPEPRQAQAHLALPEGPEIPPEGLPRPRPIPTPTPAPEPEAEPEPPPLPPAAQEPGRAPPAASEPEPVGWQQRFEQSPFGRGALSTVIVVSLIAIVAINLPGSDLRRQLLRPGQPYLNALGLDQNWSLFAPNPRRVVIDVSAAVTYDDGRVGQWTFPHDGALIGTYRDYRWRKWAENLISPDNAVLWRGAALWAASHESRVGHAVQQVALVERWAPLEPPGTTPSTGPLQRRVIYVLRLPSGGGA